MNYRSHYQLASNFLKRFKDYALPVAIVLGIIFYPFFSWFGPALPYIIIAMLFFSYLKVSPSEFRIGKPQLILAGVQLLLAVGSYYLLHAMGLKVIDQGAMMCFLCPAAGASPVIVGMLGGSVAVTVTFLVFDALMIAFFAPFFFSIIAPGGASFIHSVWVILKGVLPLIFIPLTIAMGMRFKWKRAHKVLSGMTQFSYWLWVFALAIVIAQTFSYMVKEPKSEIPLMVWLFVVGIITCAIQFAVGKWLSKVLLGETITLGQALGQKNSSLGIWMAQTYLNPLGGVALAAYSICQNFLNAAQLMLHNKKINKSKLNKSAP